MVRTLDKTTASAPQTTAQYHVRVQPSRGWLALNLRELWKYRDLLQILSLREVQLRYKQTALGVAWVVLQPLLTSAIFAVIFGRLANLPSDETPYELFAFVGLLPWNIFSQSLQRAGGSLVKDINLVTKVYFPRMIIPLSSSISTVIDFFVSLGVLLVLYVLYGQPLSWNALAIPALLAICLMISVGVGLWVSAFSVFYRDFIYALPFVIQVWLYASPIAYSGSIIPEGWRWLYDLNPMVGVIDGFRWALLGAGEFPLHALLFSLGIGGLIFLAGMAVFRRIERSFADVI